MKQLVRRGAMKSALLSTALVLLTTTFCLAQDAAPPAASTVMDQAMARAKKENKKVFLIFHASWCVWCKKMEASIHDPVCKKMFEDNYVITYLDVQESKEKTQLENPGGLDVMKRYKGEEAGLPFWVVLDEKGALLADSKIRPAGAGPDAAGENVGCPTEPGELNFFAAVLKSTSGLKEADLAVIRARFAKNKPVKTGAH